LPAGYICCGIQRQKLKEILPLEESMITEMMEKSIGEIVRDNFRTAEIFEAHNIDFCCGGKQLLGDACLAKGLRPEVLLVELETVSASGVTGTRNFNAWELDFLVDYIVNNHHSYVRGALPSIDAHAKKVASVHGMNHPEVVRISALFSGLKFELEQHLHKEEEILFPYIKNLAHSRQIGKAANGASFGTIQNPIDMMTAEHEQAGADLEQIRILSGNYTLPSDACSTYTVLYQELHAFERDLHHHIHLENNILFPKALALEAK
jgi:regulator of cell morphogenesis and NO signaling